MLHELSVRELGVIDELDLVLEPGLTAITGETGAGKTLVVEALALLLGGRADQSMVRAGATEASVEARFSIGSEEIISARVVAREGRSRAYLDGRMATLQSLEQRGSELVELYAQHASQLLSERAHQREALDRFAGVDLADVRAARDEIAALSVDLERLGGDDRQRARERDLACFELDEIDKARITGADEERDLAAQEDRLANAVAQRAAAEAAYDAIAGDESGARARLASARRLLEGAGAAPEAAGRLRGLEAESDDISSELRRSLESFEEDPARLEEVRERRQLLRTLMRKYGESLAEVLATRAELALRIEELGATEVRRAEVVARLEEVGDALAQASERVGDARRAGAALLAGAVEERLHVLGLRRARIEVTLGAQGIADDVELRFSANAGEPAHPLARVASGGELARAMLALRLVLTSAPPTLVFDEVDAGIGGEAALAVGRALAELGERHQVIVVTHLAQVAAFAQHQLVVDKHERNGRTTVRCRRVEGEDRVVELSRMLSGYPDSTSARAHAEELLVHGAARSSAEREIPRSRAATN